MKNEIWRLDAAALTAGIRNREFSAREVVTACLERLESVNPTINAIIEARHDEALAAADAADRAVADGKSLGSLHGVPVTIKGNVDLAGWATVNGCAALKDNIAPESSPCVQNWLDAGAIVLGRTNTPEFSVRWETNNELFGPTRNPWDLERTPGGSSGGAAASLAVGITPLAHGTDLGGSLRHPAQACGLASIRPSRGRVPDYNPTDPAEPGLGFQIMNVNGPMARRVGDVRLGLKAMAPGSWRDPWWVPAPLNDEARPRGAIALVLDPLKGGIAPQVRAGVELAGKLLTDAGYEVAEAEPPRLAEAVDVWRHVCIGEVISGLEPAVRDICGPALRRTFNHYRAALPDGSPVAYADALARRRGVLRDWLGFFQDYPLIVAPVGTEAPLPRDGDIESPEQTLEVMHSFRITVAVNALGLPSAVVPVGIGEGLPQVVQIIGPPFQELRCLAAAEAIEQQLERLTPIDPVTDPNQR